MSLQSWPGLRGPSGPIAKPRVRLDADEVVLSRQLEKPVADPSFELQRARPGLRAVLVLDVGDGEGDPRRHPGPSADRGGAAPVGFEQVVDGPLRAFAVVGVPGRVDARAASRSNRGPAAR